ncbi:MAG: hypothetical protein E7236_03805 [Lachnospiraceae bacterium]|nr:hypothetical protein [Lachnospiraceae bacterium]
MDKARKDELENLIRQIERENDELEREYRAVMTRMEQRAEKRHAERTRNLRQMNEYGVKHARLYDIMEEQEKQFSELDRIHESLQEKIRHGFFEERKKREAQIERYRDELKESEPKKDEK